MTARSLAVPLLVLVACSLGPALGEVAAEETVVGCPDAEEIMARLRSLELERTSRTVLFGYEPPWYLYEKALERPGRPAVDRHGLKALGVLLASVPVEWLWMAVNDEPHHEEGDYLPLQDSRVIDGPSRGSRRIMYQHFRKAGVGRWWVDEVEMNGELFAASGGALWEIRWRDLMSEPAGESVPEGVPDPRVGPINSSVGAWLLIPLAESCTLVDFYTHSDPGGFLSVLQWLGAGRVVKGTIEGMAGLAAEHIPEPHPGALFVRPDGTVIERPQDRGPGGG